MTLNAAGPAEVSSPGSHSPRTIVGKGSETSTIQEGTLCAMPYPSSMRVEGIQLLDRPERAPAKFAIPVSPRVDLFLGCRERPAVPVSLTPPPQVTLETMNRDDDYLLVLRIDDGSVTEWLSDFRDFVLDQCEERPGLFGFQGHHLESAVKPMGVNGHLAVRVPQDSSPYPPHIQFAQRHYSGEHAGDYTLRTGSVAELVAMPAEVLQGARVVPYVQISHLWHDRGHCGICPRLSRMIVIPPEDAPSPFEAAGF